MVLPSIHQEFKNIVRANTASALQPCFIQSRRQKFTEMIARSLGGNKSFCFDIGNTFQIRKRLNKVGGKMC